MSIFQSLVKRLVEDWARNLPERPLVADGNNPVISQFQSPANPSPSASAGSQQQAPAQQTDYRDEVIAILQTASGRKLQAKQMQVGLLAPQGQGKSCFLEHLLLSNLEDPAVYAGRHEAQGVLTTDEKLEASQRWLQLCNKIKAEADPSNDEEFPPLAMFTPTAHYLVPEKDARAGSSSAADPASWVQDKLDYMRDYRLIPGYQFRPLGVLLPPGNAGSAGSTALLRTSYGGEPQVLVRVQEVAVSREQCIMHLKGKRDAMSPEEGTFYARQFKLLTGRESTDEDMRDYLASPSTYKPPLLPWVEAIAGCGFIFRSRTAQATPNLLAEVKFVGDVLQVWLPTGDRTKFKEMQLQLLQMLAARSQEGPWAWLHELGSAAAGCSSVQSPEVVALQTAREALIACVEYIELFLPNTLYQQLDLQIVDTLGWDSNPRRSVLQRQLESELDCAIFMLEKSIECVNGLQQRIMSSPLLSRWVKGQEDPNAAPPPIIAFMVYREKEGLKKPQVEDDLLQCSRADRRSRAVRGEHVAVYDLVNSRDHVRDSMEAMAAGVHGELQELLEKLLASMDAQPSTSTALGMGAEPAAAASTPAPTRPHARRAAALLDKVPIFYSLPMLGVTLYNKLHELARMDPADRDTELKELKVESVQQLVAAAELTQVDQLLGLLALPQLQRTRDFLQDAAGELGAYRQMVGRVLDVTDFMEQLSRDTKGFMTFTNLRAETAKKTFELHVQEGGVLCQDVRDMFQRFYNTVLGPLVGRLVDEQLAPQVQRACSHVADRLIYTFLRTGDNRLRGIMMHALQPSHGWQQGSAPLHTWLSRELAGLHFQGVVDVIQNEYKPKVLEESAGIVTNAIFNLFSYLDQANRIDEESGALMRSLIHTGLLQQRLDFSHHVGKKFHNAFFGNARVHLTKQYHAEVMPTVVSAAVKRRGRLMAKLNQIIEAEGNGAAIGQGQQPALHVRMAAVIREWFRGLGQKLAEKLKKELLDYVEAQNIELRMLLFENFYRMPPGQRYRNMRMARIPLMYAFKMGMESAVSSLTEDVRQSIRGVCEQLHIVVDGLGDALSVDKLVDLAPDQLQALLRRTLAASEQYQLLLAAPQPQAVRTVVAAQAAVSTGAATNALAGGDAGEGEAGSKASQPQGGAPSFIDGNGRASAQQVSAFMAYLTQQALGLVDCPGAGNNCGFFAVLSQVLGIARDAGDAHALATVMSYRRQVASYVEQQLHQEEADGPGPDGAANFRDAILGGEVLNGDRARARLAAWLAGVRGSAPIDFVGLAALATILAAQNMCVVHLHVYSPSLSPASGYHMLISADDSDSEAWAGTVDVHIANLPANGVSGELNHWQVVTIGGTGGDGDGAGPVSAGRRLRRRREEGGPGRAAEGTAIKKQRQG